MTYRQETTDRNGETIQIQTIALTTHIKIMALTLSIALAIIGWLGGLRTAEFRLANQLATKEDLERVEADYLRHEEEAWHTTAGQEIQVLKARVDRLEDR